MFGESIIAENIILLQRQIPIAVTVYLELVYRTLETKIIKIKKKRTIER